MNPRDILMLVLFLVTIVAVYHTIAVRHQKHVRFNDISTPRDTDSLIIVPDPIEESYHYSAVFVVEGIP